MCLAYFFTYNPLVFVKHGRWTGAGIKCLYCSAYVLTLTRILLHSRSKLSVRVVLLPSEDPCL